MQFSIKHLDPVTTHTDCLVVGVHADSTLSAAAGQIDRATGGMLKKLAAQTDLKGTIKQTLIVHHPAGIKATRLVLVGLGDAEKPLSTCEANRVLGSIATALKGMPARNAILLLDGIGIAGTREDWLVREAIKSLDDANYRFDRFKSKPSGKDAGKSTAKKPPVQLASVTLGLTDRQPHEIEKHAVAQATAICAGRRLARDLGNLPPNVCHPVYLAQHARQMARKTKKLHVTVLDEKQIQALGMGAFMSVTQGSEQPGRVIALEYKGGKAGDQPYVFVGKGITFDTGGVSLKPGAGMDEMKYDMCGAAAVFGVMHAVIELKLPINVVGVIAAAENMPSGRASRPGDIVTTLSGQTVEILNTDAEGRLVLCDVLTWIAKYQPKTVIDIATLTGACVVALGNQAHGLYSNNAALADALLQAGQEGNDRAWQMPLWDEYQEQLDSPFADMANIGGPKAGSVTAACFLARFTKDYQWAHLDIAGTAWHSHAPNKGATGRPVSMLVQYLLNAVAG